MTSESIDFNEVLTILEEKRSALDTLIANLKAVMSVGALGLPGNNEAFFQNEVPSGGPVNLPTGAFLNKSTPAAVTLYLSAVKKKQTASEIAMGLKNGGFESTSKNFEPTIKTALYRLRKVEKVLRFPDGWALAEFYPDHIRASQLKMQKKLKRKKPQETG